MLFILSPLPRVLLLLFFKTASSQEVVAALGAVRSVDTVLGSKVVARTRVREVKLAAGGD